ncbi:MAG: peptidase domain-containing ABC transporter [Deltaproteobacteria bacterium]|nr:peptidase domain-containing ABC transporter [Deltaproteobacteria bacterium]MBP7291131.1 peptidase domain-containing ABC transporter [Nannocystaceae bacterium]
MSIAGRRRNDRRLRIPFVSQLEWADCGAACLTMVLRAHGSPLRLADVRRAFANGRDGCSAAGILEAAHTLGLEGRGIRLDLDDLGHLRPGTILHWEFQHFVVFEGLRGGGVDILDPARGRRRVPLARFRSSFTGVAIVLEPTADLHAERGASGRSPLRTYLARVTSARRVLVRIVGGSLLLRALALALPATTAVVIDRVVPQHDLRLLLGLAAGATALLVMQMLTQQIRALLLLQLRTQLDTELTGGFLRHLVRLPFAFFLRRSAGDLILRVTSNRMLRERLTTHALSALLDGPLVLLYLVLVFAFAPGLGWWVSAIAAAQIAVFVLARLRIAELTTEELDAQSRSHNELVQILAGIQTLKVCGAEARAIERWSNLFTDELNVSLARGRLQAVLDAALGLLRNGAPIALLAVGAHQVMRGQLSVGAMLAVNSLALGFLAPLASLVETAMTLQGLRGHIERIADVLETAPEQAAAGERPSPRVELRGAISLREVSFRYEGAARDAVHGVSLDIAPGECVALVGRSGCGKSSLAALLVGLHLPSSGAIAFDGRPLASLDLTALRRNVGVVLQTPYLFGGSIRDNIALADPHATLEQVEAAAQAAGIHAEIAALPLGYDTPVSDGGASLSGGQRQRVALARALLGRPRVLLLDEATSALDAVSERGIMAALARLDCVRIIISHRLGTLAFADRIVVLEDGCIVESGDFTELSTGDTRFARLVHAAERTGVAPHEGASHGACA